MNILTFYFTQERKEWEQVKQGGEREGEEKEQGQGQKVSKIEKKKRWWGGHQHYITSFD